MTAEKKHWNTIVIGGGQAGLSAGYYLKKAEEDFVILDASAKTGDVWRARWDSMRLFTPNQFNVLPGWSYPGLSDAPMTKEQMAEYLELYVNKFSLPMQLGINVMSLSKNDTGFVIKSNAGTFTCNNVVVATGTNQVPHVPAFSSELSQETTQLHAAAYRNPADLPYGKVLVVGSAISGIQIALEVSGSRDTLIAGKPSFVVPAGAFRFGARFYWWVISNILTVKTPMGRKAKPNVIKGGAVIPQILVRLKNANVTIVPRVAGVKNGMPLLEDGRVIPVSTVIWCTGYRPDFNWIHIENLTRENGWPVTKRGVSTAGDGLYFVGIPFQFALSSGLVGGVGRDAEYVVNHLLKNKMVIAKI